MAEPSRRRRRRSYASESNPPARGPNIYGWLSDEGRHAEYLERALFLYCVLRGMSINISQVMANEIQVCANTMNNKAPLGNPSMITHLCELAGVNISTPPFERPRKAIDEAYYRQYCGGDEAAQPVPPHQPPRRRRPP
ncbi:hypothetical protein LR48_Vigan377s000300 [Vigna angularis]|uniref:Putative plant transposon protein domain-containing protein n=1 Tax=Phaseolus angularis TaxID=3914 RepID=A0A0L9T8Z3_PHAAN|nr:hypothetical protein LR48_Vigan377s000300 [Vigna angularis]